MKLLSWSAPVLEIHRDRTVCPWRAGLAPTAVQRSLQKLSFLNCSFSSTCISKDSPHLFVLVWMPVPTRAEHRVGWEHSLCPGWTTPCYRGWSWLLSALGVTEAHTNAADARAKSGPAEPSGARLVLGLAVCLQVSL